MSKLTKGEWRNGHRRKQRGYCARCRREKLVRIGRWLGAQGCVHWGGWNIPKPGTPGPSKIAP